MDGTLKVFRGGGKMQLVTKEEVVSISRPPLLDRKKYFELAAERGLVSTNGSFFLMGSHVFLCPSGRRLSFGAYYFTSKKAALNFYNLFYKGSYYPVILCRRIKTL